MFPLIVVVFFTVRDHFSHVDFLSWDVTSDFEFFAFDSVDRMIWICVRPRILILKACQYLSYLFSESHRVHVSVMIV
ncbi:predicted protein [Arabidopsis lyrata subsp. lyrata]|uniref:Predicted protein n=1 Tax=Arabidopsis lyrata subsp. lyrata TaxID=81972 RepID=D7M5I0_ARALL|nr:predicted protein [Arabidopsis lyrata subsp. lyrata]